MLENRDMTSFGISIGTGLALETLFNPTTERYDNTRSVDKVDGNKFSVHYYNVYTLARNMLTSLTSVKDKDKIIKNRDFVNTLKDEILIISSLYTGLDSIFVLYIPSDIKKKHQAFNVDKDKTLTKSYLEYSSLERSITELKIKLATDKINIVDKLPDVNTDFLLFDHFLVDFMVLNNHAWLLESHTGKVKPYSKLSNKYHPIGPRDLSHLPMSQLLLYILGDKTLVVPLSISLRIELYNLSIECNWTPKTTRAKMLMDFDKSEPIKQFMLKYKFKTY